MSAAPSREEKLAFLQRCRDDLYFFAEACLKIRTKEGQTAPLRFNEAQQLIHAKLEAQKAEKGWIRTLILKGRQQGASTYVAARFYHKTSLFAGVATYILAHEQPASDNLFSIVDRYQRHNAVAPKISTSNVKELVFGSLDSSYQVATAGQKAGGRGRSISLFHGSEVAFWASAPDHFASSVQAVPLLPGTEVILESTGYGPAGEFYERWQDAEAGRGDYIPIFVPWFISREYRRSVPAGFVLDSEATEDSISEVEYAEAFGLDLEQMAWRRAKISELRDAQRFAQEYPAIPAEAWVSAGNEPYIKAKHVLLARKRKVEGHGPLILGVDPASNGGDRFSIAARRGSVVEWVKHRSKINEITAVAWIKSLIDDLDPARVFIDAGNIGHAIITLLRAAGPKYAEKVRSVNFGGTSQHKLAKPKVPGPSNRRAEMWQRLKEWLEDPIGASLPDMDALQSDICAPRLKPKLNNDFILESKQDMKARSVRSPDLGDSVALTFASFEYIQKYSEPKQVTPFGVPDRPKVTPLPVSGGPNSWMC